MTSSTDTTQHLRTPTAGTIALWSLAGLEAVYYLTTNYGGNGLFAAYLWLALDLVLIHRISRSGRYAWAALVALHAFNLPTYLFAATGTVNTGQSTVWLPAHALLTLAILAILFTPAVRARTHPTGRLPIAPWHLAALIGSAVAISILMAVGLQSGQTSHAPVNQTQLGAHH